LQAGYITLHARKKGGAAKLSDEDEEEFSPLAGESE